MKIASISNHPYSSTSLKDIGGGGAGGIGGSGKDLSKYSIEELREIAQQMGYETYGVDRQGLETRLNSGSALSEYTVEELRSFAEDKGYDTYGMDRYGLETIAAGFNLRNKSEEVKRPDWVEAGPRFQQGPTQGSGFDNNQYPPFNNMNPSTWQNGNTQQPPQQPQQPPQSSSPPPFQQQQQQPPQNPSQPSMSWSEDPMLQQQQPPFSQPPTPFQQQQGWQDEQMRQQQQAWYQEQMQKQQQQQQQSPPSTPSQQQQQQQQQSGNRQQSTFDKYLSKNTNGQSNVPPPTKVSNDDVNANMNNRNVNDDETSNFPTIFDSKDKKNIVASKEGTININGLFKQSIIYGDDKIKYNGDMVCTEETTLKVILDSYVNVSIIPKPKKHHKIEVQVVTHNGSRIFFDSMLAEATSILSLKRLTGIWDSPIEIFLEEIPIHNKANGGGSLWEGENNNNGD